jgi:hypothetical protein
VNGQTQGKEKEEIEKSEPQENQQKIVSRPVQVVLDVFQGEIRGEVPAVSSEKAPREGSGTTRRKT